MRNMSFALTADAIRNRTKTVTRRLGWRRLSVGTLLQPVVQSQGIPKGGKVEKIGGPIRVVAVDQQRLDEIAVQDVHREGFPQFTKSEFIRFFKRATGCRRDDRVTRIAFEYVDPA